MRPRTAGWIVVPLVLPVLALLGCDALSPTDPGDSARPLPSRFALFGTATSTESDGSRVDCLLELEFELGARPRVSRRVIAYSGTHGGALRRAVRDAAGNGLALWPHVHGEAAARSIAPDRIELALPGNADSESRFWRELASLRGTMRADGSASGTWTCAPFDIDEGGHVDTRYTAAGVWELEPLPPR